MISTVVIAFLLGFSPTQQPSAEIEAEWNSLSQEEIQVLVENFETEYNMKLVEVSEEDIEKIANSNEVRAARALDWRDSPTDR